MDSKVAKSAATLTPNQQPEDKCLESLAARLDANEQQIILREPADMLTPAPRRRSSQLTASGDQPQLAIDHMRPSGSSSPDSDLNEGPEDAASIASRLSQIVIEEETRLRLSQEALVAGNRSRKKPLPQRQAARNELGGLTQFERVQSSSDLAAERAFERQSQLRRQASSSRSRPNLSSELVCRGGNSRSSVTSELRPLGQPIEDARGRTRIIQSGLDSGAPVKSGSTSMLSAYGRQRSSPAIEVRVDLAGAGRQCKPERGHLKRPASRFDPSLANGSTCQVAETRARSSSASLAADQLVLAREAALLGLKARGGPLTLGEFDQAFEGSECGSSMNELCSNASYTMGAQQFASDSKQSLILDEKPSQLQASATSIGQHTTNRENNLLVIASINSLKLSKPGSGATNGSLATETPSYQGSQKADATRLTADFTETSGLQRATRHLSPYLQTFEGLPSPPALMEGQRRPRAGSEASFAPSLDSYSSDSHLDRGKKFLKSAKGDSSEQATGMRGDDDDGGGGGGGGTLGRLCSRTARCLTRDKLAQHLPILGWLPDYTLGLLWQDLVAGLVVATLNISTSLSAAVVAETDLGVGFRASIVNTFVYAILCTSRHASFGSWSIMSQMLLVSVQRALSDELILNRLSANSRSWTQDDYDQWHLNIIIMDTFLIGVIQLACGLLKLGNTVASFIPEALCSAMVAATALIMSFGQLANMSGTSNKILWAAERNTTDAWADLQEPPSDITDLFGGGELFRWLQELRLLAVHLDKINPVCVALSACCLVFLVANQLVLQPQLERLAGRKMLIPSELLLLVLMVAVSQLLGLSELYQVPTCGPIEIDFVIPNVPNLRLIRELWFQSLATALISYTMVCVMAKTYGNKFNQEIDCNQELIACGAGNLVGGLFDALPATASFSRTAGQVEAGGQTQMASIVNCVALFLVGQLLGKHVAPLPVCVMSATLFFGFVRMMRRFSEMLIYWRICKVDFAIWMVTFVAILALDIVNGFVYGFLFSLLTMLYRAQNRRCYLLGAIGSSDVYVPLAKYPIAHELEGVRIFQFCGPINYASAELFEKLLRHKTRVNVKQILRLMAEKAVTDLSPHELGIPAFIVLDFSMISYVDSAGIHAIKKTIEDYQRIKVTVLFASLASHVASMVKSYPALWNPYKSRFYVSLADAVHVATREAIKNVVNLDESI